MNKNFKPLQEWFEQAEYDLGTAKVMFKTGRYIYTVFMYHLCIEKALKGLYAKKFEKNPPKVHDLIYLIKEIGLEIPLTHQDFLKVLNELSMPTRYPDDLRRILKEYDKGRTKSILNQTEGLFLWSKKKL